MSGRTPLILTAYFPSIGKRTCQMSFQAFIRKGEDMKRLFTYFCTLFAVILVGSFAVADGYAQTPFDQVKDTMGNTIKGLVVNAETGQPVANATVEIESARTSVTTGDDGTFTLTGVSHKNQTLTVSANGYKVYKKKIDFGKKKKNKKITVRLEPKNGL